MARCSRLMRHWITGSRGSRSINKMNPGLNTRFWTRKDVDRSKAFMFAIQKWLKTRRIFRNLESFIGGRVRDGDYRLLKRYSKHMIGDRSWLRNLVKKFTETVRFENDHFGAIMGYEDYVIGDNVISWHRRLNHLNFGTINDLARKDLVRGLPRLKFEKDHLCSACQLGKSKRHTHKPKAENTNLEVLNTLYMDLCGPMRVQIINGKKYILLIVDDYSRFTWVKFLRSKDETTDVGIFHQKSVLRTPQQNDVVERWNRTLVEAARTIHIFFKAMMFLWAEALATACYT
nr:hypothetical protein [Tanacetum cinerariifolium]